MIEAIIVTEGEYTETRTFQDKQHLGFFEEGFSCGAGHYGAGSFGVYTLEDLNNEDVSEATKELIRKHLQ
jgi:hypothetical protein